MPFFWHAIREADIHIMTWNNDAQAVRPNDPHAGVFGDFSLDLVFQFAAFFTGFFKTRRNDDDPQDTNITAIFNNSRDTLGIGTNDRKVRDLWEAFDILIARDAHDGLIFRINRVNHPLEAPGDKVSQRDAAHAVWIVGYAYDGDPLRPEYLLQSFNSHMLYEFFMSFLKTSTKVGYFVKKLTEVKREDKIEVKIITLRFGAPP
jgi:hypothetical protein